MLRFNFVLCVIHFKKSSSFPWLTYYSIWTDSCKPCNCLYNTHPSLHPPPPPARLKKQKTINTHFAQLLKTNIFLRGKKFPMIAFWLNSNNKTISRLLWLCTIDLHVSLTSMYKWQIPMTYMYTYQWLICTCTNDLQVPLTYIYKWHEPLTYIYNSLARNIVYMNQWITCTNELHVLMTYMYQWLTRTKDSHISMTYMYQWLIYTIDMHVLWLTCTHE